MNSKKLFVIIPAAGRSVRMGGEVPKILMDVEGIPVIGRTLIAFERFEAEGYDVKIIVVTALPLAPDIRKIAEEYGITRLLDIVEGGDTRTGSVYNGVMYARTHGADDDDLIFIHDGARCLIDSTTLSNCLKGMASHDICAAAVPVKSTIKEIQKTADGECLVTRTPDRDLLMEIQTPQCFTVNKALACYGYSKENNIIATDDTALAEELGFEVYLVQGAYTNIKITTPEDIPMASSIARREC
ncbi:2-C-methyl-D-erythritol 4-phosphate cytidylyltransferase [Ruminococcaceae bacterium YRB3002]|nr:2-C-methyl-D-erythritol 4-phosphate cytidylyltransferase [Ruminococcaceae bacterium YRB3002]